MKKVLLTVLSVALMMGLLAGCGSRTTGSNDLKREFVYVPNEIKLNTDGEMIRRAVEKDDILYTICRKSGGDEEQDIHTLRSINLNDGTVNTLPIELSDECYAMQMIMNTEGNLVLCIECGSKDDSQNTNTDGMMNGNSSLELWEVSAKDGTVIGKYDITKDISDENDIYIQYFCIDKNGTMYLSSGQNSVYFFDNTYKSIGKVAVNSWINDLVVSKEGDVYVTCWGEESMEMKKIDPASKSLGAAVEGVKGYGTDNYFTGADQSFLITNNTSLYNYDLTTAQKTELFQWFELSIDSSYAPMIGTTKNGDIWITTIDTDDEEQDSSCLYLLKKTKASEVKQKENIYYGTMWLGEAAKKNILAFNKSSEDCQILVKEYGTEDYAAGITQLNAEITSGNCPDIIDISSMNYSNFINKGLLEDLKPYMEKSGIKSEDYLQNILASYDIDGKLYGIMPCFLIDSYVMKTANANGLTGWNLNEMLEFTKGKDPKELFQYASGLSMIYSCIYYNMNDFIDWNTGECHFDSEDFINVLKVASTFPKEESNMNEGITDDIRDDKLLLMQTSLSSVHDYQIMRALFNEDITYIGFPNKARKGNIIEPCGGCLTISSKSKYKDKAWEFISYSISEEAQQKIAASEYPQGFPIKKSALDASMKKQMEPIPEDRGWTYGMYDFTFEVKPVKQEEVDAVMDIINNAEIISPSNSSEISKIIDEEAEACLSGQKSAEDTAKVIQNRIQTYVNENR